ncbi:CHRD domain-containing protein [Paenibacillus sp. SC116]|uniref:CHRD domain-containing protein n=1 Tax=Paenibacillus sp. SC116 TaxID=2968986 RepID=UPI00215AB27F|nr:CHRD domain-containing protein [Paenibacillus sp. SC116]MCR8845005.1 CHRD domain-containing protein [Paenibacillus sp. SC116]
MGTLKRSKPFKAVLRGRNEVPPVKTKASGIAVLKVINNGTQIRFRLAVRNISKVLQAHIHLGRKGANGPIVAFLFGTTKFPISVKKGFVTGVLTSNDLVGPLAGRTIADLVSEIRSGNAYVNVHTVKHPNGEIRGQLHR